ncbi:DUF6288 domain-containing protein [Akkermansiaceae bacterium]|nr:DUF6288 domain-containing protein [Akkermansiaceae bacterium]MDB4537727.1 DUF6288 domain-containing protein [Akkermansiaceae bacterium]
MMTHFSHLLGGILLTTLGLSGPIALAAGGGSGKVAQPDFTKGDPIPEGYTHDWNLGPTGLRGWIYSDRMETSEARQIKITKVDQGSPSDGILKVGDVILGIGNTPFQDDPRTLFGKAITEAEKTGRLSLLCWREGKTKTLAIPLKILGSYSATAPFSCDKSRMILVQGWKALAEKMERAPTEGHIITRALNASALLASGDPQYLPLLRKQAELLSEYNQSSGVRTWSYAYVNVFLAEYLLATKDDSTVETGLKRITKMIVDGQSAVGSWGHGFVDNESKRLGGYGMMNAPGIPLTYSLVLARQAGVQVPGLYEAITKSERFLEFYVGKGAIPYGDHSPWIETHDDNGKNGMAAVLFDHLGKARAAEYFSRMSVACHGAERDTGHTGPFFNMLWALPSVARSGPQASGAWLEEFSWHYDLARRWDGTFLHQGAPSARPDSYRNWDCTGLYLISLAQGERKTFLTGRKAPIALQIDRATATSLLNDGRGWSNNNRHSYYESRNVDQLIENLSSWSPTVRERAAMALGKKQGNPTPQLIKLLQSSDLYSQYGACQALKMIRGRGAEAVPALLESFKSDDLWLRVLSADALAGIGQPAKLAIPMLLERLTKSDPKNDPRNMEQRYLSFALFNQRGGLLGLSLEGVDRELLFKAVRAGLLNEDGRARSSYSSVYQNLSYEEIKPLLPAIHEAILTPAPSGIMFADGIQTSGLELFTKHHISEGIELLADYARTQKQHASEKRIGTIMNMIKSYGAHAQRAIPRLEKALHYIEHEEKNFPPRLTADKARIVREAIAEIKASTEKPKLIYLNK